MTKRYIWTNEYSVGVVGIDEQHKEFLSIVNNILDLEESESLSDKEIFSIVDKLSNYGSYHLSTEEFLFEKTHFEYAHEHIVAHDEFRKRVKIFAEKIKIGGIDKKLILKELADFSGNWLMQHILIMDKKYSKLFIEKGVK